MLMGQPQSHISAAPDQTSSLRDTSPPPTMESLLAEAAAYGEDENESIDGKAKKALECPCIADLRNGLCGSQFSEAFVCFLKSTAEEKGSDCVHPFVALQQCIKAHPDAFAKDFLEDDQVKNVEPPQDHNIIPPEWSLESQGNANVS
ncbi:Oxidoreductase [Ancistrocladus abbreviatus]